MEHILQSQEEMSAEWFPEEEIIELERIIERHRKNVGFETYVEREEALREIEKIEKKIYAGVLTEYEKTLKVFLERYGVETTVRKIGEDVFAVETTDGARDILEELPSNFVYVGGTARAVLERSLGVNKFSTPRDTDIVAMDPSCR